MKLESIAQNITLVGKFGGEYYACFEINGITHREFIYFDHDFHRYININFKRYYID